MLRKFEWLVRYEFGDVMRDSHGQRPAPSMTGFASSACKPVYSSRRSMCPYSFSAARATSGSEFHSENEL